jgi:hypothetical protein
MPQTHTAAEVHALAVSVGFTEKEANTMTVIVSCESNGGRPGGDALVVSKPNRNGTRDVGLAQINTTHLRKYPHWTIPWLQNPRNNLSAAKILWDDAKPNSTQPWVSSMDCWLPKVSSNALVGTIQDPLGALGSVPNPIDVLRQFVPLADAALKLGSWVGNPANWVRIVQVTAGMALGIAAASLIAKPAVDEAARTVRKVKPF